MVRANETFFCAKQMTMTTIFEREGTISSKKIKVEKAEMDTKRRMVKNKFVIRKVPFEIENLDWILTRIYPIVDFAFIVENFVEHSVDHSVNRFFDNKPFVKKQMN